MNQFPCRIARNTCLILNMKIAEIFARHLHNYIASPFFFYFSTSSRTSKKGSAMSKLPASNWLDFIFLPVILDHFSLFVRSDRRTSSNGNIHEYVCTSNPSALFSHILKGGNEAALFNSWISGIAWARKIVYKLLRLTAPGL